MMDEGFLAICDLRIVVYVLVAHVFLNRLPWFAPIEHQVIKRFGRLLVVRLLSTQNG
jgi:hypothetical protein